MDERSALGRTGEDLAARLYVGDGYRVVARNFRSRQGEIDLIAARDRTLVFCEVKTRRTDYFGTPAEAVTFAKRARLKRLAAEWLSRNPAPGMSMRFDIVSVLADGRETRVERLEDAF
jgi:putative endonuclease